MNSVLASPTLVEFSVWVELPRATGSAVEHALAGALGTAEPLWVTGVVLREVLQGARDNLLTPHEVCGLAPAAP